MDRIGKAGRGHLADGTFIFADTDSFQGFIGFRHTVDAEAGEDNAAIGRGGFRITRDLVPIECSLPLRGFCLLRCGNFSLSQSYENGRGRWNHC